MADESNAQKVQPAEEVMTKPQEDVEEVLVKESPQFCVDKQTFNMLASSKDLESFTAGIGSVARRFASYNFSHLEAAMQRLQTPSVYEKALNDYARLMACLASGSWREWLNCAGSFSYRYRNMSCYNLDAPEPEVHLIWISHMLRSEQYQSHCEEHLGGLVDHDFDAVVSCALDVSSKKWLDFVWGHPNHHVREDGQQEFRSAVADLLPHSALRKDTCFFAKLMQHFASLSLDVLANRSLYMLKAGDASNRCSERFFKELDVLLEQQYGLYLAIAITCSNVHVSPSIHMDWLWHTHLLSPAKYRKSCLNVLGRVVHHQPKPKGFAATNIEDLWRSVFDEISTDAIVRLTEPFIHDLELEELKRVQAARAAEFVHRVAVVNIAGETVTTLQIKAKTSQISIKEMIEAAGGPRPKCQKLILPNATELGAWWDTAGDSSSSDCLTLVEIESVASPSSASSASTGCMD